MASVCIIIAAILCVVQSGSYSTNFSSLDSKYWELLSDCTHCSVHNGEQCTQESPSAVSFASIFESNKTGATITTAKLSKTSSCGANCSSGHLQYIPQLLYSNITVIAKWYPAINGSDTSTGEGFIDAENKGNTACITFGFHGDDEKWPYQMTTDTYANNSVHQEVIVYTKESLSEKFNTFQIIWTKDIVQWIFNGKIVRNETDKQYIPQEPMYFRLHDRSQNCAKMTSDNTFIAQFAYFECTDCT